MLNRQGQGGGGAGGGIMRGADYQRALNRKRQQHRMKMIRNQLDIAAQQQEMRLQRQRAPLERRKAELEVKEQAAQTQQEMAEAQKRRREVDEFLSQQSQQVRALERQRDALDARLDVENMEEERRLEMQKQRERLQQAIQETQQGRRDANQQVRDRVTEYVEGVEQIDEDTVSRLRQSIANMGMDPDAHGIPKADQLTDQARQKLRDIAETNLVDREVMQDIMEEERAHERTREEAMWQERIPRLLEYRRQLRSHLERNPNDELTRQELDIVNDTLAAEMRSVGSQPSVDQIDEWNKEMQVANNIRDDAVRVLRMIDQDPTRAGIVGWARGGLQSAISATDDVLSAFGEDAHAMTENLIRDTERMIQRDMEAGRIDEDDMGEIQQMMTFESQMFDDTLPQIKELEKTLAYRVARMRKPMGRLNVQDIENALETAKIHGFHSARDVVSRYQGIYYEATRNLRQTEQRMDEHMGRDQHRRDLTRTNVEVPEEDRTEHVGTVRNPMADTYDDAPSEIELYWSENYGMYVDEHGNPIDDDTMRILEQEYIEPEQHQADPRGPMAR